jgi:hypothetical protein
MTRVSSRISILHGAEPTDLFASGRESPRGSPERPSEPQPGLPRRPLARSLMCIHFLTVSQYGIPLISRLPAQVRTAGPLSAASTAALERSPHSPAMAAQQPLCPARPLTVPPVRCRTSCGKSPLENLGAVRGARRTRGWEESLSRRPQAIPRILLRPTSRDQLPGSAY